MNSEKTVTFYLEEEMRRRAEAGLVNVINRMEAAFASVGVACLFRGNSDAELLSSVADPGYAMFFMEEPFHERALTMRLAYHYPFWRIEKTAKRWEGSVARAEFRPEAVEGEAARRFAAFWRRRLYGERPAGDEGFIYVPLQGRLLKHRSFQAMSPIDMLAQTIRFEPYRKIIATLHPKENYTPAELQALEDLSRRFSNLEVTRGDPGEMARDCHYIVTQNSGAAIAGFFFGKPAVLFGRIDFHHICANVPDLGVAEAFRMVRNLRPDYDRYLFWFLQEMSINAGREEAEEKILATVRARGWRV
jgi:hypothetical protein